jgi:hypothetical protein
MKHLFEGAVYWLLSDEGLSDVLEFALVSSSLSADRAHLSGVCRWIGETTQDRFFRWQRRTELHFSPNLGIPWEEELGKLKAEDIRIGAFSFTSLNLCDSFYSGIFHTELRSSISFSTSSG